MRLTIVLATRARPHLLVQTLAQTLANMVTDSTLMVAVDHDDHATIRALATATFPENLRVHIHPREDTLGAKYNRAMTAYPADLYLTMVDHSPHLTRGFDAKVIEAASLFPDGIGVVYNHLADNASFPQLNGITHGLAERMGFIYPPYFPYWFIDHWLDDIARLIDRISFVDVRLDCSKRPGTMELREPAFWGNFFDALGPMRRACAQEIVADPEFQERDWRKSILLTHYPLIEWRSRWVNNTLRQLNDQMERQSGAGPGDARYLRIKSQALRMLEELSEKGIAA